MSMIECCVVLMRLLRLTPKTTRANDSGEPRRAVEIDWKADVISPLALLTKFALRFSFFLCRGLAVVMNRLLQGVNDL